MDLLEKKKAYVDDFFYLNLQSFKIVFMRS